MGTFFSDPNEAPSVEFIDNLIAQREGGNAPGALNWVPGSKNHWQ